jgi:biopolymer transport protein ExbD
MAKMKIHRPKPTEEIPQASLADIAFLLLIFFIATTTIAEEFGLSLILPAKAQGGSQEVNRQNVMVISTDAAGTTYLVDDQPVMLRQIRDLVKEREAANPLLVVSVEPHVQAPYRAMVDILDELKVAGASRISLKTKG